ncbi:MAG: DUF3108 domain-containing protein [Burkholderiales bacterium]|nr:DUF3108 domain-containing protein [Burkholderiales bacterium]
MTTAATAPLPLASLLRQAQARAGGRTRQVLAAALALSLAVHVAITLWPVAPPPDPDATPLTATLTELPPPPKPAAAAPTPAPPKPKPRRASPVAAPQPAPAATGDVPAPEIDAVPAAPAPAIDAAAAPGADAEVVPGAATDVKTLPPRVDLAYKVFLGTRGFLIGEAVYRFEHADHRYRIATIGEARGLAALVLRGQGKVESRGLITDDGLQPLSMRVERGGPDRVETAVFDWEAGIVTMHDNKTAPLDLPTFDPLSLMWQYYFTPPVERAVTVTVATPRRLFRYTISREDTEPIEWSQGTVEAERWHRRSDDGKTDAYVWVAPTLRYIPVKIRVVNSERGTIEAVLDAIRVDEVAGASGNDELRMPSRAERAASGAPAVQDIAQPQPAATFPTMTGQ